VDDIETKLDVLIEMYKADRQPGTAASDNAVPPALTVSSSSKLLHGPPLPLRRDQPDDLFNQHSDVMVTSPLQQSAPESVRRARPSRPMVRNLSDLGPRVTCRSTALWPPVSVLLTSAVSPTEECPVDRSPSPSSRRHPPIICESNDEVDHHHFPQPHDDDDDNADVIGLLPLPVADGDDTRVNHVAPQQFVDHVTPSSNVIGRTVSPSDNSQSVIVL